MIKIMVIFLSLALVIVSFTCIFYVLSSKRKQEKLSMLETELSMLETKLSNMETALTNANNELFKTKSSLRDEIQKSSDNASRLMSTISQKETELGSLKAENTDAKKTIDQLKKQLNDVSSEADAISLENAGLSVEIIKLTKRLADAEARLTPPIVENISDEEIVSRIMSLHQEDINGQKSVLLPLFEKMKTKTFTTDRMRELYHEEFSILGMKSFVKEDSYRDKKVISPFITPEILELAASYKIRVDFKFDFGGRDYNLLYVSDAYEKELKKGWHTSNSSVTIFYHPNRDDEKNNFYRLLGHNYDSPGSTYINRVSLSDKCGVNTEDLNGKFVCQVDPILEEDISDLRIILSCI